MRAKQSASRKEAGWRDALCRMSVTELTSQLDRSELKEEAWLNAARDEMGQSEDKACTRQASGRLGRGTHCHTCW